MTSTSLVAPPPTPAEALELASARRALYVSAALRLLSSAALDSAASFTRLSSPARLEGNEDEEDELGSEPERGRFVVLRLDLAFGSAGMKSPSSSSDDAPKSAVASVDMM